MKARRERERERERARERKRLSDKDFAKGNFHAAPLTSYFNVNKSYRAPSPSRFHPAHHNMRRPFPSYLYDIRRLIVHYIYIYIYIFIYTALAIVTAKSP
jgi:hypothetical protein